MFCTKQGVCDLITLEKKVIDNFNMKRQEKGFYCSAGSMQAIFANQGIVAPQDEIYGVGRRSEKNIQSPSRGGGKKEENEGLGHLGIISIAKHYNLPGFVKRKADIDCLKFFLSSDVPVLVNWWQNLYDEPDCSVGSGDIDRGHYSVIIGYEKVVPDGKKKSKYRLCIADPSNNAPSITYWVDYSDTFLKLWYDVTRTKLHDRWMAAFFKKELDVPFSGMYVRNA